MISIFNGRARGLGREAAADIYLQVSVALRQHLHHFKGSRLCVFMAVALHSDQDGWSRPCLALLRQETGYNKETISQAITELCQVKIIGERVLLVVQERLPSGLMDVNRYLVFPTKDEVEKYEGEHARLLRKARRQPSKENSVMAQPKPEEPDSVKPNMVAPDTVEPEVRITTTKQNQKIEEPKKSRFTRTANRATRTSSGVTANSIFSLEQCLCYANYLRDTKQGIKNPGGYATTIYRTGEADELIKLYFRSINEQGKQLEQLPTESRLTSEQLKEYTAFLADLLAHDYTLEQITEQFAASFHAGDWQVLKDAVSVIDVNRIDKTICITPKVNYELSRHCG